MATRTITITSNSSKGIELAGVTVSGSGASYNSSTKQLTMSSSDTTTNNITFKVKPKNSSKVTSKSIKMKTVVVKEEKQAWAMCYLCNQYVLLTYDSMYNHAVYHSNKGDIDSTSNRCMFCGDLYIDWSSEPLDNYANHLHKNICGAFDNPIYK